jgi:hypothetical protein
MRVDAETLEILLYDYGTNRGADVKAALQLAVKKLRSQAKARSDRADALQVLLQHDICVPEGALVGRPIRSLPAYRSILRRREALRAAKQDHFESRRGPGRLEADE